MTIKFGEWISVGEALPAHGLDVLVLIKETTGCHANHVASVNYSSEENQSPFWQIWIYEGMVRSSSEYYHVAITLNDIFDDEDSEIGIVTHWMPLPPLPDEVKNG